MLLNNTSNDLLKNVFMFLFLYNTHLIELVIDILKIITKLVIINTILLKC